MRRKESNQTKPSSSCSSISILKRAKIVKRKSAKMHLKDLKAKVQVNNLIHTYQNMSVHLYANKELNNKNNNLIPHINRSR